jgi:predicted metal-dependent HD superfamily phosphohydrolase
MNLETPLLTQHFLAFAPQKDRTVTEPLLARLITKYSEKHRFYHNLVHVENGLEDYFAMFNKMNTADLFAWAYHDVEYEPLSSDNEERSAAYFMRDREALGFEFEPATEIADAILRTKHTGASVSIVNDIDLAILGKEPAVYKAYAANIRREYSMIEQKAFCLGRIEVLQHLLKRPYIYLNGMFRGKYEAQARINMDSEIQQLTAVIQTL